MKTELLKYQRIVNDELSRLADSIGRNKDPFIKHSYKLLKEYLMRGGKRLRPISCIKAYEAFSGKKDRKILLPAIGLELFHSSSLVHDDIMDEDEVRRNKASMHSMFEKWFKNNVPYKAYSGKIFQQESLRLAASSAIIQGNIMFSAGMHCLTRCEFEDRLKNEALDICQNSYRRVNEGQMLDLVSESKSSLSEKEYIHLVILKTGELFAYSVELGALFAKASKRNRKIIRDFAINIAIAFQIQDDIMDIDKNSKKGNTLGSDIMKGKRTLLLINAMKKASKGQRAYLKKIVGKSDSTKQEIENVIRIFEEAGAIDAAKQLAMEHIMKGKETLKLLEKEISPEGFKFFNDMADYMAKRSV